MEPSMTYIQNWAPVSPCSQHVLLTLLRHLLSFVYLASSFSPPGPHLMLPKSGQSEHQGAHRDNPVSQVCLISEPWNMTGTSREKHTRFHWKFEAVSSLFTFMWYLRMKPKWRKPGSNERVGNVTADVIVWASGSHPSKFRRDSWTSWLTNSPCQLTPVGVFYYLQPKEH